MECTRGGGRPKLLGRPVRAKDYLHWSPGPQALKPLLLVPPDSRPRLGVLWATFYRSKVPRDVAALLW